MIVSFVWISHVLDFHMYGASGEFGSWKQFLKDDVRHDDSFEGISLNFKSDVVENWMVLKI